MTSEAYVWIWLPGADSPVVCGKLFSRGDSCSFVYGLSYLENPAAIALDPLELPLREEVFSPSFGELHSVLRDAAPDAWGRRVLHYRHGGRPLSELDYLLLAGNDRVGALDFTTSATDYRTTSTSPPPSLAELIDAAQTLEAGKTLPESLGNALLHASSVGGARPKALLSDAQRKWIAKFSSSSDYYPVVRYEYAAMWLAGQCGITVPETRRLRKLDRDVLLVERFDRVAIKDRWQRRFLISGLTALKLHETEAILASYPDLAAFIRRRGRNYPDDSRQLYRRMVFNILIGNTDDHARNHAFFWDGQEYALTPAYDICPMLRVGQTAAQAMIVGKTGRESTLRNASSEAEQFGLTRTEAAGLNDELATIIREKWPEAADRAELTKEESQALQQATILSPACFY